MSNTHVTNLDSHRKLGDKWENWNGKEGFGDTKTSPWIYFLLCIAIVVAINMGLHFMLYLVTPRFFLFHPILPKTSLLLIIAINLISTAFLGYVFLAYYTQLAVIDIKIFQKIFFGPLAFFAFLLGKQLHISKDRMGNSFIWGANKLMSIPKNNKEKTLILLPRCLKKEILKDIRMKAKENSFDVAIVDGGTKAREKIKFYKPDNVVAVACERDLLSGILDIAPKLRVFGLPNQRPEGPCKNTVVSMDEFNNLLSKCKCNINKEGLCKALN